MTTRTGNSRQYIFCQYTNRGRYTFARIATLSEFHVFSDTRRVFVTTQSFRPTKYCGLRATDPEADQSRHISASAQRDAKALYSHRTVAKSAPTSTTAMCSENFRSVVLATAQTVADFRRASVGFRATSPPRLSLRTYPDHSKQMLRSRPRDIPIHTLPALVLAGRLDDHHGISLQPLEPMP